jgi:antitoxin component YwqK of YwqJK toxin-antitoxin module
MISYVVMVLFSITFVMQVNAQERVTSGVVNGKTCFVFPELIDKNSSKFFVDSIPMGLPDGLYCKTFKQDSSKVGALFSLKNGNINGLYETFYFEGGSFYIMYYIDGKHEGHSPTWDKEGCIREIKSFKDGELHGAYYKFNQKGKIIEYGEWHKGSIVSSKKIKISNKKSLIQYLFYSSYSTSTPTIKY